MHRHINKWSCIHCLYMATSIGLHARCVESSGELSCVQYVWIAAFVFVSIFILSFLSLWLSLVVIVVDVIRCSPIGFSFMFAFNNSDISFFSCYSLPIDLKFSYLLSSMHPRLLCIYAIVWNCIDIKNLCDFFLFHCHSFRQIFYLLFLNAILMENRGNKYDSFLNGLQSCWEFYLIFFSTMFHLYSISTWMFLVVCFCCYSIHIFMRCRYLLTRFDSKSNHKDQTGYHSIRFLL